MHALQRAIDVSFNLIMAAIRLMPHQDQNQEHATLRTQMCHDRELVEQRHIGEMENLRDWFEVSFDVFLSAITSCIRLSATCKHRGMSCCNLQMPTLQARCAHK